jgi:hypothetical protein
MNKRILQIFLLIFIYFYINLFQETLETKFSSAQLLFECDCLLFERLTDKQSTCLQPHFRMSFNNSEIFAHCMRLLQLVVSKTHKGDDSFLLKDYTTLNNYLESCNNNNNLHNKFDNCKRLPDFVDAQFIELLGFNSPTKKNTESPLTTFYETETFYLFFRYFQVLTVFLI